jgi:preprotein translocase subunit SecE
MDACLLPAWPRNEGCFPGTKVLTMARKNPFEFIQEVRNETSKVTWPTRRETLITTVMVFVMVVIAAIFFVIVDQIIKFGLGFFFG